MKKTLFALAILAATAAPVLAANPPPPPQLQPRILLIDRQAILRMSKVGQDVAKQVQTYADQAKADIAGQQKALQTEAQQLQQQVAILAADARAKKLSGQFIEVQGTGEEATFSEQELTAMRTTNACSASRLLVWSTSGSCARAHRSTTSCSGS